MKNISNLQEHWVVEFNECGGSYPMNIKSYKGEIVTKELLDEVVRLDEVIHQFNELVSYLNYTDQEKITHQIWTGYYKFYFDKVENGEVVSHWRVDVGDGYKVNAEGWRMLYNDIK